MKKSMITTAILAGVTATIGTAAYTLLKTEKGRGFSHEIKGILSEKKAVAQKTFTETSIKLCTIPNLFDYDRIFRNPIKNSNEPMPTLKVSPSRTAPHSSHTSTSRTKVLQARRTNVLKLYESGLSSQEIATKLYMTVKMVEKDLAHLIK